MFLIANIYSCFNFHHDGQLAFVFAKSLRGIPMGPVKLINKNKYVAYDFCIPIRHLCTNPGFSYHFSIFDNHMRGIYVILSCAHHTHNGKYRYYSYDIYHKNPRIYPLLRYERKLNHIDLKPYACEHGESEIFEYARRRSHWNFPGLTPLTPTTQSKYCVIL